MEENSSLGCLMGIFMTPHLFRRYRIITRIWFFGLKRTGNASLIQLAITASRLQRSKRRKK